MMSQNSHENGQPREYCTDMQLYFLRLTRPKSATRCQSTTADVPVLCSAFRLAAFEVNKELRQRSFGFTLKNVVGVGKFLDGAGDVRATQHDDLPFSLQRLTVRAAIPF
jgi:hypothetical protein